MSETPASDSPTVPLIARFREMHDRVSAQGETVKLTKAIVDLFLAILTRLIEFLATPLPEPAAKPATPRSVTATRTPSSTDSPTRTATIRRPAAPAQPEAAPAAPPPPRARRITTKRPTNPQSTTQIPANQPAATKPPNPHPPQIRRSSPIAFARKNRYDIITK